MEVNGYGVGWICDKRRKAGIGLVAAVFMIGVGVLDVKLSLSLPFS